MKDDSFEPTDCCESISLGAALAVILGSLASAVLTAGTAAFFLLALMLSAGDTMAAQPADGAGRANENAPAQTKAADPPQLALNRETTVPQPDRALVARGRYLVQTAGCNDCHTPGYAEAAGKVPEQAWLTGDRLGWGGPWGTSYATNLRLRLAGMSRDEWLHFARAMEPRPPMPWFNVRAMDDHDLTAIWAYVQALGPAGEPAPEWVPPGQAPVGPVVRFPQ